MTSPFPPPGFVQATSRLEGITVYQPAPQDVAPQPEVVDFKCLQCGAVTGYSVVEGGLKCNHCGHLSADAVPVVGQRAAQFEFTVETVERAAQGWGLERKELECQNCGSKSSVPPEDLTHTCAFCGSNKVIQRAAPQDILRPRYLVTFKIEPSACQAIAAEWLQSSWMTPGALQDLGRRAVFTPLYLPFWSFSAQTHAEWKAEVGHTRTERYYSDGEWKTRTVTDWVWEGGRVRLPLADHLVVGTTRLSRLLLDQIKNFNLGALQPYEPQLLAGLQAQAFDLPLDDAWDQGRAQMREVTRQACVSQTSTSQVRNFSMALDFAEETWRYILMPVYLSAYTFEGKLFQVMVNGQSGAISGQRPVDWNKVWLAIAGILSPGLLLLLIGVITLPLAGFGVILGGLGFILLVAGLIAAFFIYRKADALDDI